MRVLHVINGLGTGGAERSLAEMLPLLRDEGIDSVVACLIRRPDGVHTSVEAAGIPVRVIGSRRVPALRRLRSLIEKTRPDIVHTTIFEADLLGRLAAVGKPCRVLTSIVNTTYDAARIADPTVNPYKLRAAKALDGFTARHLTDHFHAITAAVRDSAVIQLGIERDQITVVERGRDLGRLGTPGLERRRAVRVRLGLTDDAEVVLHIGRQEPQKDIESLLAAVAHQAANRPRLVLMQVGRAGKSTPELHRMAGAPELDGRVRFLGHRDDIGDLLSAADVFAFPSVYEGLGGSVLEALAMGVPTVVSAAPALVEVVEGGRGALVVPIGNPSALGNAISLLLDEPVRGAELAGAGRQIFNNRFTLDRCVTRMVELYKRVGQE